MNSDGISKSPEFARSWESYWHGAGDSGAFSSEGGVHPAISGFWSKFFTATKLRYPEPRLVDLAVGNGAVITHALDVLDRHPARITCVDSSEAAIASVHARYPDVHGVVGDIRNTTLQSGAYDAVTSQFGVEYAGLPAIEEAVRLLANGGHLAFLLHHDESSIHLDCAAGLDAVSKVREERFVPLAIEFFNAGFAAVQGADRRPYETAARQLQPAVKALERIVEQRGEEVAGGVVADLYSDVSRIHQRIQHYERDEVLAWLNNTSRQLEDYAGRMSSMVNAALDSDLFDEVCRLITDADCTIEQAGPLYPPGESRPLAWALLAAR